MAFYLHHYFDPDFSHQNLAPLSMSDGDVCNRYLGYVQNVVAGQVLAELIDLSQTTDCPDYDTRFVFPERVFPCGPNCAPHPTNPSRIIATANGYCFYNNGLITVKKLLNVRRDVDFHTGNILFVGDIISHATVRTGFTLQGNKVLVKGTVEGATIKASSDIVCESGLKGAGSGLLESDGNIKLLFCENMRIRAKGNVEIEGSCLHSEIYVGGSLMVKERLQGGAVYANNIIYVKEQLGGGQNTITKLALGYDPYKFFTLQDIEQEITKLYAKLELFERRVEKKPHLLESHDLPMRLLRRKLSIKRSERDKLLATLEMDERNASRCRIICPGKIKPGLEISIAKAYNMYQDFYSGQEFVLDGYEIVRKAIK